MVTTAAPRRGEVYWADLHRDSVANVSQILTIGKGQIGQHAGVLDSPTMRRVEEWLKLVLALGQS